MLPVAHVSPLHTTWPAKVGLLSVTQHVCCRCICDLQPHTMDAEGCQMLNNFAELVVRELERDQVYHQQLKEADMSHSQVCPAALTWVHCTASAGQRPAATRH